ncbi:hypothetical protein AAG570_002319 [Ranatra chinensis]|uniref:HMG box domain-containing protein n=1 Tax=Ranatra chinensis TaxID=642074 RepID=A0ABD0YLB9_9HEMI
MSVLQGNLCKLMNASWPAATCRFSSKRAAIASVENQLGIQPKPKKPVGAFLRFTSKIRPELVQKYPTASITDLVKLAAAEWKNVDSQTKAQLQEETKAEWARYMEECRKYESQLSPGVKLQLENAAKKIQIAKEKKVLKKKREDLGRPKKPPTSFVMFFLSKSAERGTMPFKEWQAKMAKAWEELPEAEKSKIIAAHKKETEEYKQRLTDWEKKMVAEGKSELVRV